MVFFWSFDQKIIEIDQNQSTLIEIRSNLDWFESKLDRNCDRRLKIVVEIQIGRNWIWFDEDDSIREPLIVLAYLKKQGFEV